MAEAQNPDSNSEKIILQDLFVDETSGTEKKAKTSASLSETESGTTFSFVQKLEQQVALTPDQMDMFKRAIGFLVKEEVKKAQEPLYDRITKLETLVSLSDLASLEQSGSKLVDPDAEWIALHQQELEQYKGLYVAISDGKIIGSGSSPSEARKAAKEQFPDAKPVITRVSKSDFGL